MSQACLQNKLDPVGKETLHILAHQELVECLCFWQGSAWLRVSRALSQVLIPWAQARL